MGVLRETKSVCPECLAVVRAVVTEENGRVLIKKDCEAHGHFEDLYWSDYELYKWAEGYYRSGTPLENPQTKYVKDCFYNCGLCTNHKSHTVLAIIDVTSRCNMACPGCFAASGGKGPVYEPTGEQVRRMLNTLQANKPIPPKGLQFSGGEPTLRDDLPELVRMAKEAGFSHVEVNTNGIRIARDIGFFKSLIEAGMSTLYLQFDSLRPEAVQALRGANVLPQKMEVIAKARRLGFESIVLVVTLAKDINDADLGSIVDFAVENSDVVRCVNVQPISFAGRGRGLDPVSYRITIPDFMRLVEEQTGRRIQVSDFRPVPWPVPIARAVGSLKGKVYPEFSTAPWCGVATFIVPDGKGGYTPITRLADVDAFAKAMQRVEEEARAEHRGRARMRMMGSMRHVRFRLFKDLVWGVLATGTYTALGSMMRRVVMVGAMHFMDLWNMDLQRLERCVIHYATPDPEHPIIPFCSYNNYWRPIIEKRYARDAILRTDVHT